MLRGVFIFLHFILMIQGYKDGSLLIFACDAFMHYWWLYNEKRKWAFIASCVVIVLSLATYTSPETQINS